MIKSTRLWLALLLGVFLVSVVLSNAFTVEGNNNDPVLAEMGNAGMPLAALGLVILGAISVTRWAMTRRRVSK